jgi:N-acetylneuraminic acid mutarotase
MVKSMQEKRSYFYACAVVSNHSSSNEKRKINFENNRLKECLYAIGGRNREGSLRSMERYEPCTDTWTAAPMLPSALYAHSGCSLDSVVYVSGGYGGSAPHNQFTSDLYAYEPSATEWTQLRPMNAARGWHCMCTVKDKLYVFGGCILLAAPPALNSSANQPQPQIAHPVQTTEYYSIETNQWTIVKPMMNFHKEANCLQLNNFVYILGGYNIQTKTGQKIISRYDYSKDIWHTYGQHLPAGMTGMGCCLIQLPWFLLNSNDQPIAYASSESSVSLSKGLEINDQDDDDETDEDSYYDGDEESDNDDNNEQEAVNTQSIQSDKKNSIKKGLDSRNDLIKSLSLTPTTNTTI